MKKLIIILLIVLVIGAGLWYVLSSDKGADLDLENGTAAIVNGEKIANKDLQTQITQTKQMYPEQDLNLEQEKQLEAQILDQMIGSILLKQEAKKQDIAVDQEEINSQMSQMIQNLGGEEAFNEQLQSAGLTEKQLRERMKEQVLVQKYIDSEIPQQELEVTDEEIKTYFNQIMAQQGEGSELPSFEEMEESQKEQLRSQLKQQKQSLEVQQLIKQLKQEAEITTSL
ncbi:MAG TPA: SurA N-terminal domain-containing protein [Patescibacteria group bacterium]|nr:SurA N-terminal domain-containing protein [Patescibacteria group bacterium]